MAFDWKEYLALARSLENQTGLGFSIEASTRCAVSRAYYAAYCHARNHAESKLHYVRIKGGDDHKGVRDHYIKRNQNVIASKLETLNQWRGHCDYEDEMLEQKDLLTFTFMHAQHVIKLK
jgi:hypothetical protein